MARQNIRVNPSEQLFEAYMDFSGGLNSETSNEKLQDNEFPVLDNVDLASRGSAKRRTGRRKVFNIDGNGQGLFYYYRKGFDKPDIITAVSGKLYRYTEGQDVTQVVINEDGNPFTFQSSLSVEAVQYGTTLFVATGTKLVEVRWDEPTDLELATDPNHPGTWVAKVVEPYTPTVLEALYIGTNGLASNPDAYVQDGTSTKLEVAGIKPELRTGIVNQEQNMTAYINKPQEMTSVDYKWEYKLYTATTWTVIKDWTASEKTIKASFPSASYYDVRVTVRETGKTATTDEVSYVLNDYQVNAVEDKNANTSRPVTGIQKCRKIKLHWDRLILSGDEDNPFQIYISDLNAPRYFPVTNTISFDTGKREAITSLVRYRDHLIVFTKTTIQIMTGKSPQDYQRSLIHDGIGCVSGRTAQVLGNEIAFLSEEGIHLLKPNAFTLEVMNVSRIDYPIKSVVSSDEDACAMVFDSQYWICFPSSSVMYRLYYDNGMWVRDASSKLTFIELSHYGSNVYELSRNGIVYTQDGQLYTDDGEAYTMNVESKFFDLSLAFNYKKLKRLYILARHYTHHNVGVKVTIKADSEIVLTPDKGVITVASDGTSTTWSVISEPNFHFYAGTTVGSWLMGKAPLGDIQSSVQKTSIRGKCRRVKVMFTHKEDSPCEFYGFGLEFKAKKP